MNVGVAAGAWRQLVRSSSHPVNRAFATRLWHWLHSVLMLGMFSSARSVNRAACGIPCILPPSPRRAHRQMARASPCGTWCRSRSDRPSTSGCCSRRCRASWQSLHFTRPSFTLWWNGMLNAASRRCGTGSRARAATPSTALSLSARGRCGSSCSLRRPWHAASARSSDACPRGSSGTSRRPLWPSAWRG
jgi:hypothetical protein